MTSQPLAGRRVLVTRAARQAAALIGALEDRGAEVVAVPVIATEALADSGALAAALESATDLVITSANAVHHLDAATISRWPRMWAVGPETAAALAALGRSAEPLPTEFTGAGLAAHLLRLGVAGRHYVLAQAEAADPLLAQLLIESGATVDVVAVYRTVAVERAGEPLRAALAAGVDAVTFLSASAVSATLAALRGRGHLGRAAIVCIGPSTAAAATAAGLAVDVVASVHTAAGLVDSLTAHLTSIPGGPSAR